MDGVGKFLAAAKADVGYGNPVFCHAKIARIKGNGVELSLYECT
jgi:hypothetical protein